MNNELSNVLLQVMSSGGQATSRMRCRCVVVVVCLMTIIAPLRAQTDGFDFEFGDLPELVSEHTIIGLGEYEFIPDDSRDYIVASSIKNASPECFNSSQKRTTQSVTIIGKKIVLQPGHGNGLYEVYFSAAASASGAIRTLSILAETVVIRAPIYVPAGDVIIQARLLQFEDTSPDAVASIITTPRIRDAIPGDCSRINQPAGSLTLRIADFDPGQGAGTRFDLTGLDGWEILATPPTYGAPGDGGNVTSTIDVSQYVTNDGGVPAEGAGDPRTITVPLSPTDFFQLGLIRGDAEFGSGQNCIATVDVSLSRRGAELWATVHMNAQEPRPDHTEGNGTADFLVHTHPRAIERIVSATSSNWTYTDRSESRLEGDHDIESRARPDLVSSYNVVCDANGPDVGVHTGVHQVTFYDADIVEADDEDDTSATIPGRAGEFTLLDSSNSWLHPLALQMIIKHAKDVYFVGNIQEAREILEEYAGLTASFIATADGDDKIDFLQASDEIDATLHRLRSNLDFYGNPAGWVPMLSFEIEQAAFEQEIERAFQVMYTASWVSRAMQGLENKRAALEAARQAAIQQVNEFRDRYGQTVVLIEELEQQSAQIGESVSTLQRDLQAIEAQLKQRAEDKFKKPWWQKALKGAGALLKVIPYYQPALGTIGTGLDLVSDVNFDDPWSAVEQIVGITQTVLADVEFKKSAEQFKQTIGTLNLDNLSNPKQYVAALRKIAEPIGKGLEEFKQTLRGTGAPRDKIEAELQRLKATDPIFNKVVDDIASLMAEKELFAGQLATATQAISDLAVGITQNILAVDSMNLELQRDREGIDPRVGVYARGMEQRARERLRLYHYYFIKAFEYRLLQRYPAERDLQKVFDQFRKTVETAASSGMDPRDGLSESDFNFLKGIYVDALSTVATEILEQFRNGAASEFSSSVRFGLSAAEIGDLNAGLPVTINLVERNLFFANEEDLRITNIEVDDIDVTPTGPLGLSARMSILLKHSGVSLLTKRGETYLFRHFNEQATGGAITWSANYDGLRETVMTISPSLASQSLLSSVVGETNTDLLIFSRPAAWADISIGIDVRGTDNGVDMRLDRLVLKVDYDYHLGPQNQVVLDVATVAMNSAEDLAPHIRVSRMDLKGRTDGLGRIRRSYSPNAEVTIEAPVEYGMWTFDGWTDHLGNELDPDTGTAMTGAQQPGVEQESAITVKLVAAKSIQANYACKRAECTEVVVDDPCPFLNDGDCDDDESLAVSWPCALDTDPEDCGDDLGAGQPIPCSLAEDCAANEDCINAMCMPKGNLGPQLCGNQVQLALLSVPIGLHRLRRRHKSVIKQT